MKTESHFATTRAFFESLEAEEITPEILQEAAQALEQAKIQELQAQQSEEQEMIFELKANNYKQLSETDFYNPELGLLWNIKYNKPLNCQTSPFPLLFTIRDNIDTIQDLEIKTLDSKGYTNLFIKVGIMGWIRLNINKTTSKTYAEYKNPEIWEIEQRQRRLSMVKDYTDIQREDQRQLHLEEQGKAYSYMSH